MLKEQPMETKDEKQVRVMDQLEEIKAYGISLDWTHDVGGFVQEGPDTLDPGCDQGDVALWAIEQQINNLDYKLIRSIRDSEKVAEIEKALADAKSMQRKVEKEVNRNTGKSAEDICRRAGCDEDTVRLAEYWGHAFKMLVQGASEKAEECIDFMYDEEYERALEVAEDAASDEREWGDDPVWSKVACDLEELIDSIAEGNPSQLLP